MAKKHKKCCFFVIMLAFCYQSMYLKYSESYKNKHTLQNKSTKVQKYVVTDRSTISTTTGDTPTIPGCFYILIFCIKNAII